MAASSMSEKVAKQSKTCLSIEKKGGNSGSDRP